MKILWLPFCVLIASFFSVYDRIYPEFPKDLLKEENTTSKSYIKPSDDKKYYFVQIHQDDKAQFTDVGFPESGVYEFNSKKLLAAFPYAPITPISGLDVLNDPLHVIHFNYSVKDLSDVGLRIFENGKIKFTYKVNQFCKKLKRAFVIEEKKLWATYSTNANTNAGEIYIGTNCGKSYTLNYITGKFKLIKDSNTELVSSHLKSFFLVLAGIFLLFIFIVMSSRLKTRFLTYTVVAICCFLLFFLGQDFFRFGFLALDEILISSLS